MDLARVHEIPPEDAKRLREAGIDSAATLAAVDDVDALAARAGIPPEALDAHRAAARAAMERVFADAGVGHEADLATANPREIAVATGLPLAQVEQFQAAAQKSLRDTMALHGIREAAHLATADPHDLSRVTGIPLHHMERFIAEAAAGHVALLEPDRKPEAAHPSGEDRVVLVEGVSRAWLRYGEDVIRDVPLLTGRFPEDAPDALARAGEHGVFLLPGASEAVVRVAGRTHEGFPIYKAASEEGEQVRVRVKDVRIKGESPAPPSELPPAEAEGAPKKGGFLSRFGRKKA